MNNGFDSEELKVGNLFETISVGAGIFLSLPE